MATNRVEPPVISVPFTDYGTVNKIIPTFDGNHKNLNLYIRCTESVIEAQSLPTDDKMLVCLIRAKLSGKALEALSRETDINNWTSIKTALINRFGEHRSEVQILQELMKCNKAKTESCEAYGRRIGDLLDALCGIGQNKDSKYYQTLAINTFIDNLDYHLGLGVRVRQPETLEAAITQARQEETLFKHKVSTNMESNKSQIMQQRRPNFSQNFSQPKTQFNNNYQYKTPFNYTPYNKFIKQEPNKQIENNKPNVTTNKEVVPVNKPYIKNNRMFAIKSSELDTPTIGETSIDNGQPSYEYPEETEDNEEENMQHELQNFYQLDINENLP